APLHAAAGIGDEAEAEHGLQDRVSGALRDAERAPEVGERHPLGSGLGQRLQQAERALYALDAVAIFSGHRRSALPNRSVECRTLRVAMTGVQRLTPLAARESVGDG